MPRRFLPQTQMAWPHTRFSCEISYELVAGVMYPLFGTSSCVASEVRHAPLVDSRTHITEPSLVRVAKAARNVMFER